MRNKARKKLSFAYITLLKLLRYSSFVICGNPLLIMSRILAARVHNRNLTYLSLFKLNLIQECVRKIESDNVPGIFIEAGCALGGSAVVIGKAIRSKRQLHLYDVFNTIPPPTVNDPKEVHDRYRVIQSGASDGINGDLYYGYQSCLKESVLQTLNNYRVGSQNLYIRLIEGLIQETFKPEQPICFIHIDVDFYEPVLICLEKSFERLVSGGIMIVDDYHCWGGCRLAVNSFLDKRGKFFKTIVTEENIVLTRL